MLPLLQQVLERYPDDVKLVFKNFPLDRHGYARKAAAAALAASAQGKFWEYHDKLFEDPQALSDQRIKQIAVELGLDMEKFNRDMASPGVRQLIQEDEREGRKAGVQGTPTVFVNGKFLKERSFTGFKQMIEAELKKSAKEGS